MGEWKKYRKRPIVIMAKRMRESFSVNTLEGKMVGNAGDFLIIGVQGEKYPCKKEVFMKTYEFVGEQTEEVD